jgi:hypothetical protein
MSVAENINDLRRIDETVFRVAPDVDSILAKHYGDGFGFLICLFQHELKAHPIAFIGNRMPSGEIYVPTRHEHGDSQNKAHFDHTLYVVNTDKTFGATQPHSPLVSPTDGIKWDKLLRGGKAEVDGGVVNIHRRQMRGVLENNDQYAGFNPTPAQESPSEAIKPAHPEASFVQLGASFYANFFFFFASL